MTIGKSVGLQQGEIRRDQDGTNVEILCSSLYISELF